MCHNEVDSKVREIALGGRRRKVEKITYFDYCALIIFVILLVSTIFRKMTKGRLNQYFLAMLIVSILSVFADIWAINLDRMGPGGVTAKYISHTLYLLTHSLITPLYVIYIVAQTDTWHKLNQSRFQKTLLGVPLLIVMLGLAVNPFWNIIF